MSPLQSAIWNFLLAGYVGPENAAPRAVIIGRYNLIHKTELGDRKFREIVSDLVVNFKKPVATSASGGYFVARTQRELENAIYDLESKGAAIFDRARILKETIPLSAQEDLPL